MNFRLLKISIVGLLLLSCGHGGKLRSTGAPLNGFVEVKFPGGFVKTDPGDHHEYLLIYDNYEIRTLSNAPQGELLFAMIGPGDEPGDEPSNNFFAVSLDGQFKVRNSSVEEWDKADRPPNVKYDVFSVKAKVKGDEVEFGGKSYKKSGRSWETIAALPSPDLRRLAVFSHTSGKDQPSFGFLGGGGRGEGEMFIDVFDVSSGEKLLSGHFPHRGGAEPHEFFDTTVWVGNHYLIVPLPNYIDAAGRNYAERCFLGILPNE